jgi:uncharacterized alpha-E superfamily protein
VLSRIAEALFWMGRYLERADDTARILDVQLSQLLDDPARDEQLAAASLCSVMGLELAPGAPLELTTVTALLAYDREQASSIASSLAAARENARTIRETISTELWECLNGTYLGLEQRAATTRAIGPHAYFRFARFVKERVSLATGIADSTMSRDDTWQFLHIGRNLERADMTARLIAARLGLDVVATAWIALLRSCSAYEAYLRTHGASIEAAKVVEFLLLDRRLPRSAYFALSAAEACTAELEPGRGRLGDTGDARRILGRARADLEYASVEDLATLPGLLDALQLACSQASAALAARFFHRSHAQTWRAEGLVVRAGGPA